MIHKPVSGYTHGNSLFDFAFWKADKDLNISFKNRF